jgi:hypothetical protein
VPGFWVRRCCPRYGAVGFVAGQGQSEPFADIDVEVALGFCASSSSAAKTVPASRSGVAVGDDFDDVSPAADPLFNAPFGC